MDRRRGGCHGPWAPSPPRRWYRGATTGLIVTRVFQKKNLPSFIFYKQKKIYLHYKVFKTKRRKEVCIGPEKATQTRVSDPTALLRLRPLYLLAGLALAAGAPGAAADLARPATLPEAADPGARPAEGWDLFPCSPFEGAEVLLLEREGAVVFRVARKKKRGQSIKNLTKTNKIK